MRADLRAITALPSESVWSEWRRPEVTRVACGGAFAEVRRELPPGRVLEVGCGNGYLALELSREGYDVVAIDPSIETRAEARLRFVGCGIEYFEDPDPFDGIVCNRSLHHLPDLQRTVARLAAMLRPGGVIVCREFTRDTMDERTARWLLNRIESSDTPGELVKGWLSHAHELHGRAAMLAALRAHFTERLLEPLPCLYVYIANQMPSLDPAALQAEEAGLIAAGTITPAAFTFIGHPRRPPLAAA